MIFSDFIYFMEYNDRFFIVYDELKKRGLIHTQIELANVLKTNTAGVTDIKKHRKKLTVDDIFNMKNSYSIINTDFIISGEGSILKSDDATNNKQQDNITELIELSTQIGEQKNEIYHLNEKVKKLKEKNKRLQEELILVNSERKNECPAIDIVEKYHTKEKKPYSRA